jgi:hypothetical protein
VDGEVGAVEFVFGIEADADEGFQRAIDQQAAAEGDDDAQRGAGELAHEGDAAEPAQRLGAEDAGGDAAPGAAQAVQRPDAEHVVDLPAVLRQREHHDEEAAGDAADDQRAQRMHEVGAGADGDQAGQRAVMHEAGVVLAGDERDQRAADHGHQRVHGDEARDLVQRLRAHDVEAEPADDQDPGTEREEGNRRGRMRRNAAVLLIAPAPRAEQDHGGEANPAADRMHHHRAGEVVELFTEAGFQRGLDAVGLVPGDALEERVDEADQQEGGGELRAEARAFGDAAGDDGRDRRSEGQQEEELGEFIAALLHQGFGAGEEMYAVGDAVADEEVGQGRDRKVAQDLDQRIDLVLLAHRAQLQKGKAGMHGQDHDGAEQNEQYVGGCLEILHCGAPKGDKHEWEAPKQ